MIGIAHFRRGSQIFRLLARVPSCRVFLIVSWMFGAALLPIVAEFPETAKLDSALFGKTIRNIAYASDLPLDRSHYDPYIGIKPGDILTRTGVKGAIQFLYESGRFSSIDVEANPDGDAVDLLFSLRQNYYFNKFSVEGKVNLKGRSLWEVLPLPIGQRFTDGRLEEARQSVLRFMHEGGFYRAQVKVRKMADDRNRQVDTVFEVQPGTLATIRAIEVAGIPAPGAEELQHRFGYHEGEKYDRSRLNARLDSLRKTNMSPQPVKRMFPFA